MKRFITSLSITIVAVFAVTTIAAVPVFAVRGSDDSTDPAPVMSDDGNTGSGVETEKLHKPDGEKTRQKADDFRKKAQEQVDQKRKEVKGKTAEQRKKVCEERSTGINKRFTNFGANADKHLAKIDAAYTKLKTYQSTNNLDVANYDELVTAADAKQQAAADAVAALKLVNTTIDCSSTDPAASIAQVKTAVRSTHDTLKEYRKSVKDILVELRTAKENQ